jgi:hypothetical protein
MIHHLTECGMGHEQIPPKMIKKKKKKEKATGTYCALAVGN